MYNFRKASLMNHSTTASILGRKKQHGAALVIGLVLLMVMTILAVSTMRTAALELAMAGNAQYKEKAFQLAESGIDDLIHQIENGMVGYQTITDWTQVHPETQIEKPDSGGDNMGNYQTQLTYMRTGSISVGNSLNKINQHHLQIDSTGRTEVRGAESVQSQGITQLGN